MKIRFKDGTAFECVGRPIENMIFQNGKKAGWLLSFCLHANSAAANKVLTDDNISEIKLTGEDDKELIVLSYDSINSVRVEYVEGGAIADIELKRGIAT